MEKSEEKLIAQLAPWGQEHVLRFWPELTAAQQERLADQLEQLDLDQLRRLYHEAQDQPGDNQPYQPLESANVRRLPDSMEAWERQQEATSVGEDLLKAGRVGVILVAGGQGTRLGFDGPKGTFPIGALSNKSLFQLHAEKMLALSRRYQVVIPFFVMTSPENDVATRAFFAEHNDFGLETGQVTFFCQGTMPAMDRATGKLLLAAKDAIAASPNGHGGVLQALADGGHLRALGQRGLTHLYYFQVDNPLAKIADPAYLGMHVQAEAEMSLKVVPKLYPGEKLGVVAERGARVMIVEYSDLPKELAEERDADGQLVYWAGSIAIHVFNVSFLERLAAGGAMLPYHKAVKAVPYLDPLGELVRPTEPNAVKFEAFIFDAIPLTKKALVVETSRNEEFEPLKNAEGENSPASVRQAMTDLYGAWLESAGIRVPRNPNGHVAVPIEISPLYALDAEELRERSPEMEGVGEGVLLEAPSTA